MWNDTTLLNKTYKTYKTNLDHLNTETQSKPTLTVDTLLKRDFCNYKTQIRLVLPRPFNYYSQKGFLRECSILETRYTQHAIISSNKL